MVYHQLYCRMQYEKRVLQPFIGRFDIGHIFSMRGVQINFSKLSAEKCTEPVAKPSLSFVHACATKPMSLIEIFREYICLSFSIEIFIYDDDDDLTSRGQLLRLLRSWNRFQPDTGWSRSSYVGLPGQGPKRAKGRLKDAFHAVVGCV